jgi:pimeloyl-ACP methyl ester carboxylesterase
VSGAIAELPDPEVHLIHDAAHWPQFEKADEVNRHHIDFLTRAV